MPFPQPGLAVGGAVVPLGHDWTVLVRDGVEVPDQWIRWGAHVVVGDETTHPALAHHDAVAVRPDRYTSAITTDLQRATAALAAVLD